MPGFAIMHGIAMCRNMLLHQHYATIICPDAIMAGIAICHAVTHVQCNFVDIDLHTSLSPECKSDVQCSSARHNYASEAQLWGAAPILWIASYRLIMIIIILHTIGGTIMPHRHNSGVQLRYCGFVFVYLNECVFV